MFLTHNDKPYDSCGNRHSPRKSRGGKVLLVECVKDSTEDSFCNTRHSPRRLRKCNGNGNGKGNGNGSENEKGSTTYVVVSGNGINENIKDRIISREKTANNEPTIIKTVETEVPVNPNINRTSQVSQIFVDVKEPQTPPKINSPKMTRVELDPTRNVTFVEGGSSPLQSVKTKLESPDLEMINRNITVQEISNEFPLSPEIISKTLKIQNIHDPTTERYKTQKEKRELFPPNVPEVITISWKLPRMINDIPNSKIQIPIDNKSFPTVVYLTSYNIVRNTGFIKSIDFITSTTNFWDKNMLHYLTNFSSIVGINELNYIYNLGMDHVVVSFELFEDSFYVSIGVNYNIYENTTYLQSKFDSLLKWLFQEVSNVDINYYELSEQEILSTLLTQWILLINNRKTNQVYDQPWSKAETFVTQQEVYNYFDMLVYLVYIMDYNQRKGLEN